jgi:DNA-binding transcriptional ArsR family regulator
MNVPHEEQLSRFGRALGHPSRVRILVAFLSDEELSPTDLVSIVRVTLPNVSYHVRFLESLGMLELRRMTPQGGAVQHFYGLRRGVRELLEAAVTVLHGNSPPA